MAGMVVLMDGAADLSMREMILGVLQAKQAKNNKTGKNVIHSSDFRTAIVDLGFSMGSSIVENVLIYCKLDADGNLDYTELANHLSRERKVANAQVKLNRSAAPSSVGTTTKPWRADDAHTAKVDAEQQLRKVNENNAEINSIYSALSFHEISSSVALSMLSDMGIRCNPPFIKLLQKMEISDVAFSEFVRALTAYHNDQSDMSHRSAGGFARRMEDAGDQIGLRRKRATGAARDIVVYESAFSNAPQRNAKKMNTAYNGSGQRTNAEHDQRIFKTSAVAAILKEEVDPTDPVAGTVSLLSHAQHDMAAGKLGKGVDQIKYNIERKLQREQVFAALRKLDAGELSMEDFQDVLFSIGVDLPEALLAQLHRAVAASSIDLRHFIKLMDAVLFKAQALEDGTHTPDISLLMDDFRERLLRIANAHGESVSVYIKLAEVFRSMDADEDGQLTYQEFRSACASTGLMRSNGVCEDDLRNIFHAFDLDGDGSIDLPSFLHRLTSTATAAYTPPRAQIVRQAFDLLTRTSGAAVLKVEDLVDRIDMLQHPALAGSDEKTVVYDMLNFFDYQMKIRTTENVCTVYDHGLDFDAFESYFKALSAAIPHAPRGHSDPFIDSLRACFKLSAKAPAPPVLVVKRGVLASRHNNADGDPDALVAPRALQHHGDCVAWRQTDDGLLENEERRVDTKQGRKLYEQSLSRNFNTDVIVWKRREDNAASPAASAAREMREMGLSTSAGVPMKNVSSATKKLLAWSANSRNNKSNTVSATPSAAPELRLAFQDEVAVAGSPVSRKSKEVEGRRQAAQGLEEYYLRPPPFGTDDNNNFVSRMHHPAGTSKEAFGGRGYLSNIYNMLPPKTASARPEEAQQRETSGSSTSSLRQAVLKKQQQPKTLASIVRKSSH